MDRKPLQPKSEANDVKPTPKVESENSPSTVSFTDDLYRVKQFYEDGFKIAVIIGIKPTDNQMHFYYNEEVHPSDIATALKRASDQHYDSTGCSSGVKTFKQIDEGINIKEKKP